MYTLVPLNTNVQFADENRNKLLIADGKCICVA